jgi:oligosaccharide reducing-end xylanase
MKKAILLTVLIFALFGICSGTGDNDCTKDVNDSRGKMKPWEQGARETGKYRTVFLEAGYRQTEIDAKLTKAYDDIFEGPNRVYFEAGDSMAYISDLKNRDARTEGLSYGMMAGNNFIGNARTKRAVFFIEPATRQPD